MQGENPVATICCAPDFIPGILLVPGADFLLNLDSSLSVSTFRVQPRKDWNGLRSQPKACGRNMPG